MYIRPKKKISVALLRFIPAEPTWMGTVNAASVRETVPGSRKTVGEWWGNGGET